MWGEHNRNRGVSSAMGIVLLIAISMILGGIVATMVFGTTKEPVQQPTTVATTAENIHEYEYFTREMMSAKVTDELEDLPEEELPDTDDEDTDWATEIVISHKGGDALKPENIRLQLGSYELKPVCASGETEPPDQYQAGQDMFLWIGATQDSNYSLKKQLGVEEIEVVTSARVIWDPKDVDQSYIIHRHEFDQPLRVPAPPDTLANLECVPDPTKPVPSDAE